LVPTKIISGLAKDKMDSITKCQRLVPTITKVVLLKFFGGSSMKQRNYFSYHRTILMMKDKDNLILLIMNLKEAL
jgi:hypothetical protein